MKNILLIAILPVIILLQLPAHANASGHEAVVTIEPSNIIGPVNRNILGQNIIGYKKRYQKLWFDRTGGGIWNPSNKTFVQDYIKLIKQAGVSNLRWPAGSWQDSMQWEKLVGPAEKRPDNTFGIPEFLTLCREINAFPVITLPTNPKQFDQIPGLIEYLNSPDDSSNPNGGVDWAKIRASDGQKAPWNVVWFEFGNETYGSNTSPEEYVSLYNELYSKLVNVDKNIKLGAVLEDTDNEKSAWNKIILSRLGKKMGFAIIHPYLPVIKKNEAKYYTKETIALSAMASDEVFLSRLRNINRLIKAETGRNDLPLAATEYTGLFVQNKPVRFRFTLLNAIHNADFVRIMLKPSSNILFADHFHLVNGYWGMIRGNEKTSKPLVKQADYYVYELYNRFLADDLVDIKIDSPSYSFQGAARVPARIGRKRTGIWKPYAGDLPKKWTLRWFGDVDQKQSNGIVTATFNGKDLNYYHAVKTFTVKPDTLYRVSVKVKAINLLGGKVGIAVEDARGWNKTFNQPSNIELKGTTPWRWLTVEIRTLPDAKKLHVMARRLKGKGPISGVVKFGEMHVEENSSKLGNVQSITGLSTKSTDGSLINLILINKDLSNTIKTTVRIPKNYKPGEAVALSGPDPYSTNFRPNKPEIVKSSTLEYNVDHGDMIIYLSPTSLTGISFVRK